MKQKMKKNGEKTEKRMQNGELQEVRRRKHKIKRQIASVKLHQLPEKLTKNVWLNLESLKMKMKGKQRKRKNVKDGICKDL